MQKTSSKKNKKLNAVAVAMAILLCLGGFFVFSRLSESDSRATDFTFVNESTMFFGGNNYSLPAPTVSAKSAVLIEAESGEIIFGKSADERLPMASTTKIMTALVAIENADISKTVSVSPAAVGVEGSSVYLYADERMTLEDLLYAMMLESANDAATAIAIEVGGDLDTFVDMMNERAQKMGLSDTHFENPHGLDGESHYTTAYELALIAREAMSNSKFLEICSTYKKTIPLNETEGVRLLINHNKMLRSYNGAVGIKTGFTKKSGRCLVSAVEREGLTFIAVTLGAPDDWKDHTALLDYGFSLYEARTLCDVGSFSYVMPLSGGDVDHVILENVQKITVILPRNTGEIKCVVELPRFCLAPVKSGEEIGRLVYYLDGEKIAESAIIAKTSAESSKSKGFLARIFNQ